MLQEGMRSTHMCCVLDPPSHDVPGLVNAVPQTQSFSAIVDYSVDVLNENELRTAGDVSHVKATFGVEQVLQFIKNAETIIHRCISEMAQPQAMTTEARIIIKH